MGKELKRTETAQELLNRSKQAELDERTMLEAMETKSTRLQLLIKPSTKKKLEALHIVEGRSVNDIINGLIEEYVTSNAESIADVIALIERSRK